MAAQNPYGGYNFLVKFSGIPAAAFMECVLPAVTIDVMEYREGADLPSTVRKLPGLVRYGNLVLRRGLTTSLTLWDWFNGFVSGTGTVQTIGVVLLDSTKSPVLTWTFRQAWPVKYESPVLDGKKSALAIETLEVAVGGMDLAASTGQTG